MSQNWMRHFELQLIDDKGDGISLSDFKVTFNIQKMPATIFNGFVGNFKIYNLSPETQNRIMGKEFTRVRAIAGYNGTADSSGNYPDKNVGIIFNGDIRFTVTGKDNVTDSWVLIQCIDGWEGHLNASVKTTVSAGWKHADLFDLGMQSLGLMVFRRQQAGFRLDRIPARPNNLSEYRTPDVQPCRAVQG
jgi:hypothetical protein